MQKNIVLLIVDDDEHDRQLFVESAKDVDEKIICLSAKDGEQALQILKDPENNLPAYIFLDLRMPGLNGKKTLQEIKKDNRLDNIPVIIYTTSREVKEAIELKSLGATHFISKPVNPEEIYYLISSVINERWNDLTERK